MNNTKLICRDCGYSKTVMESEVMDSSTCVICGGAMIFDQVDQEQNKQEEILNETEAMNENIDNIMVNSIAIDIQKHGEEKAWNAIQAVALEQRIRYLEIFFEAKHLLQTKGEI